MKNSKYKETYIDREGKVYTEEEAIAVIPNNTDYCYELVPSPDGKGFPHRNPCPFYDKIKGRHEQDNGYCHFCRCGDWECSGVGLLWDMVKCCGIKETVFEEEFGEKNDNN